MEISKTPRDKAACRVRNSRARIQMQVFGAHSLHFLLSAVCQTVVMVLAVHQIPLVVHQNWSPLVPWRQNSNCLTILISQPPLQLGVDLCVTSSSGILGEMTMQAEPIYFYGFDYANHQKALGAGMEQWLENNLHPRMSTWSLKCPPGLLCERKKYVNFIL